MGSKAKALHIAFQFGDIDGAHHKMWVIDQMVRALCDDKAAYDAWVKEYEQGDEMDAPVEWDTGIAP